MTNIIITQLTPEHIPALVLHQQLCFPTLAVEDLFSADNFAAHLRVFPEGQHIALVDGKVAGQSSTFRISGERVFVHHTFPEIIGYGYFTEHDPVGDWLYGADMSVHPDYRRLGLARRLYDARKALIRSLGMRGMVAGGMLPGFPQYRDQMDVETYVAEVVAGRLTDPTLTPQLRNGFEVRGVLRDHLSAGALGNDASLIVWEA
jgi:GNAT superfamily N-acetyltransferase